MKPTLYAVRRASQVGAVAVEQVWEQSEAGPLQGGYHHLFAMRVTDRVVLIGIGEATDAATTFQLKEGQGWIVPIESQLTIGGPWDVVEPFVIGNIPHLLAYVAEARPDDQRQFALYPLDANLQSRRPYEYRRVHAPGVTAGFTVAQPIAVGGAVYYLCYGFDSGRVLIYSLAVSAQSAGDTPPLVSQVIWEHQWARKWTRFAFFQLGADVFFLKTNVGRLNVNIDKVRDDPSGGTVEVATKLELENALELDFVRTLYLGRGEPYFLTYKKDGSTTLNRFHSDLSGWATEARLSCVSGATHIVPFRLDGSCYVLFY